MKYFNTQEEALELFKKLQAVKEETRNIIITVEHPGDKKLLKEDMAILLQGNPLVVRKNSIHIKGNSSRPAIKIIIMTAAEVKDKNNIAGISDVEIILV